MVVDCMADVGVHAKACVTRQRPAGRLSLGAERGVAPACGVRRSRADAERALSTMSGAMLGSRRIRCGWAQHKQESAQASYAAVDRVRLPGPPPLQHQEEAPVLGQHGTATGDGGSMAAMEQG